MKKETKCVHSKDNIDVITQGINTPIFVSTAHNYVGKDSVVYPRYFNTVNQKVIEDKICVLENAENSIVFSSGMAAITTVLFAILEGGDHAIFQDEIYGGSHAFVENYFKKFGILSTFVDKDAEAFEEAITPKTKIIYIETPTNPLLGIVDIKKIVEIASNRNLVTVIDNTFATPILQNPLNLGVDIVVHSGTKYLGGHSDLSCGVVATNKALGSKIRMTAVNFGGNVNPLTCHILERSLKTLNLRVERQTKNAFKIAEALNYHPKIDRVFYPGLKSHKGYLIAKGQMSGFGAMLSFRLKNPKISADDVFNRLKIVKPAVSLGGIETTICDPARTSHAKVSPKLREKLGIGDNLLRLSVGIEDANDLIEDIFKALETLE